uniref:Uncharacterized protein n=1 Tax=Megaselia scalaris TaxID=36166 RepID=T1GEN0_MEGSC
MKAHFAIAESQSVESVEEPTLDERIIEFKNDEDNMKIVNSFVDGILTTAQEEVDKKKLQQESAKKKESRQSFSISDIKNAKVVNRASRFAVQLFDVICNRANNATAPMTQRFRKNKNK